MSILPVYHYASETWVITSFFNPANWQTRALNYELFAQTLRQSGIPLLTMEMALPGQPFTLPDAPGVVRVRAECAMWQKERLLNLALRRLPDSCRYVVWADADVLFENPAWLAETKQKLATTAAILQPFTECVRLRPGELNTENFSHEVTRRDTKGRTKRGKGEEGKRRTLVTWPLCRHVAASPRRRVLLRVPSCDFVGKEEMTRRSNDAEERWRGFCATVLNDPHTLDDGRFDSHGHTGFCWAARRDLLCPHGFYDALIAGGGDNVMAHAAIGNLDFPGLERLMPNSPAQQRHYQTWAQSFSQSVAGRVSYVDGRLLHLWHGSLAKRQYSKRHHELARLGFNPYADLRIDNNGCWQWARRRPELEAWAESYFHERDEDEAWDIHQTIRSVVRNSSPNLTSESAA